MHRNVRFSTKEELHNDKPQVYKMFYIHRGAASPLLGVPRIRVTSREQFSQHYSGACPALLHTPACECASAWCDISDLLMDVPTVCSCACSQAHYPWGIGTRTQGHLLDSIQGSPGRCSDRGKGRGGKQSTNNRSEGEDRQRTEDHINAGSYSCAEPTFLLLRNSS